jgi:hypothetical protein
MDNLSDMTANAHPTTAVFIESRRKRIQRWTDARRAKRSKVSGDLIFPSSMLRSSLQCALMVGSIMGSKVGAWVVDTACRRGGCYRPASDYFPSSRTIHKNSQLT